MRFSAPFSITRSPTQKPARKDTERNDQNPVITFSAAYAPVSNRVGSRFVCHSTAVTYGILTIDCSGVMVWRQSMSRFWIILQTWRLARRFPFGRSRSI
ncbi:hypothetical protein DBQ68_09175 [Lactobacillus sp. DS15_6]|nr:hypothetical protein F0640_01035 [Lacticaseibacillus paracasei]PTS45442.1 hypothetical protein DBQ69_09905 [Lactobacillus sp. DS1_6]PTS49723.1 hypothetical protein DBQ60_09495 [Lactobacillus sp. DS2_6]PTS50436.1 hypothetical protein DBQ62_07300 [Lactobacillus sp. DS9_6]PTS61298.1 hypothetical protein DBQ68_09175 [Lactobacillus sp. DS15_6]PTS70372.1 hypothetical protein DBQ65_07040 [Lactobacillus sp. DS3_6]PTV38895.1 hypothetical protein DB344_09620 [Lactobacillus sp. DS13_6]PTV40112.1 hyp